MKYILEVVRALQATNSKNDKEEILRKVERDSQADIVLRFLFDDNVTTGIKRSKLNKRLGLTVNGDPSKHAGGWLGLLEYFKEHKTGKEVDIDYLINSAKYAKGSNGEKEADLILSVICKDLKLGCGATTYNKAHPDNPVFHYDTMGGKAWDEDRARKLIKKGATLYFTEKIDGNKGTRDKYTDANIVSRNGKVWKGTDNILKELNQLVDPIRVPEGELVYNDTTGLMTSQEIRSMTTSIMNNKKILDKAEAGIVFKIFEYPLKEDYNDEDSGESYEIRRQVMDRLSLDAEDTKYIQVIPVEFIIDESNIDELETIIPRLKNDYINKGKEGLMCIASTQVYKMGKSSYQMMKLKNILSADLKIVGWNYGKEKTKWEGKFASFTVEFPYVDKKGVKGIYQVDVGSGYSDEFRNKVNENPDEYIGKILEIIITEVSKNKDGGYSLSYARMIEVREDKNTIDLEKHSLVELDGDMYFKED